MTDTIDYPTGTRLADKVALISGAALKGRGAHSGIQGYTSLPGYDAAKFGVRGLTTSVALDLGLHDVRAKSVHSGVIATPMAESLDTPQKHVALRGVGQPIELSKIISFLASDESSFSTGAEFIADGGETAGLAPARWGESDRRRDGRTSPLHELPAPRTRVSTNSPGVPCPCNESVHDHTGPATERVTGVCQRAPVVT